MDEDELKEVELVKGLEVLGENVITEGGFIMEDGGSRLDTSLGFTVEDGLTGDLGLREKDLKKFVIEFDGRRRFGMLNMENGFDDCVVESKEGEDDETELGNSGEKLEESENEVAEGSVLAPGENTSSTESSSTNEG